MHRYSSMLSEVHHFQSPAGPQPHRHRCCCALLQTVRPDCQLASRLRPPPHLGPPAQARPQRGPQPGCWDHQPPRGRAGEHRRGHGGTGPPGRDGLGTTLEKTSCFYAVEDKVGVNGPGAQPWEIYTVVADAEMANGQLRVTDPGQMPVVKPHPTRSATRLRRRRAPESSPPGGFRPGPVVSDVVPDRLEAKRPGTSRSSPGCRSSTVSCLCGSSPPWSPASGSGEPSRV